MKRITLLIALLALGAALSFAQTKDGVYSATEAAADAHGYKSEIKITVKGGVISKIEYDETKDGKNSKWKDKPYNTNMKKIAGTSWIDGVKALEASLSKKGDPSSIDAIAGATELTARFKAVAADALKK